MDVDGSHDPEFIRSLWVHRDLAEVVIASRYVQGGCTDNPPALIMMSYALNIFYLPVLKINCP